MKREEVMPEVWEIEKITEYTPDRYKALVSVLAWGGLRIGEALALTRDSFNPKTGVIHVGARIYRLSQGRVDADTPKSARGIRDVVLPDSVSEQLKDHIRRFVKPGADSLIFEANKGSYLSASTFREIFISARSRAEVRPAIYVHSLRSFAATIAAQQGATLKELMDILGHNSPEVAMRYQRNTDDRKRDVASKLDQVRASAASLAVLSNRRKA